MSNSSLKTQKPLHALAESLGHTNWHEMSRALDYNQFTSTLIQEYGVSESYADAAFLTANDKFVNTNPVQAAHDYAAEFLSSSTVTSATTAPANSKQMQGALSVLSDLLEAGDDEPIEVYGSGLSVLVLLKMSSDTTLQLKVAPEDHEVLEASIRCTGFGVAHVEPVPQQHLPRIAEMFSDYIETQLMFLSRRITGAYQQLAQDESGNRR